MKSRRLGLALIVAVIVSITATYLLYSRIKRQYAVNSLPIQIVVASKALEPGTPLSADNLTLMNWPANIPLGRIVPQAGRVERPAGDVSDCHPGTNTRSVIGRSRSDRRPNGKDSRWHARGGSDHQRIE